MTSISEKRDRFRRLHDAGCWVIPNPWDAGSARLLEHLGFPALATTSSGFAASLGRRDGRVTLDELVTHVSAVNGAVDLPVHVDAERGFGVDPAAVAETVSALTDAGASGVSIEDYNPDIDGFDPIDESVERVAAAAEAAHAHGVLLTARADHGFHLQVDDALVDEVVTRLSAYRDAGADCLYAPGLTARAHLARVVAVGLPVNALIVPGGPTVAELGDLGVRRVSTGGQLAWAAYGGLAEAARELADSGTVEFSRRSLRAADRAAFDEPGGAPEI